jgi:hypothetical protein
MQLRLRQADLLLVPRHVATIPSPLPKESPMVDWHHWWLLRMHCCRLE